MLSLTDRTKDLIKSGLFIGGLLLMILGWAVSASLFFWIALVAFVLVLLLAFLDRDLTAIQFFACVALSLVALYSALSHSGA